DQGWYNGPLHTMSRINSPRGLSPLPAGQPIEVAGLAFAGNRGISKVEVSVDDGVTWNAATLASPISPDSWVFWTWQWTPIPQAGKYKIMARATDGTGAVQTDKRQGTVPNGATGYPIVMVEVK
ncbi:MAG: Ig-like domain-containing protein, partial [Chloroflexota bacterium]|nr:Ig-like domain-containing protein [Chloroflexota bacterium]